MFSSSWSGLAALAAAALLALSAAPRADDPPIAPFFAQPSAVSCFVSNVETAELQRLIVGDVNGDEHMDFLSFAQMTDDIFLPNDRLCVMLGQPGGTFVSAGSVFGVPAQARCYAGDLGDLTGDGHADLLLATRDNGAPTTNLQLYAGDGAGGFTKQPVGVVVTQDVQWPDKRLALRDTDADGDLDALLSGEDDIALYENLGGGSFAPGVTLIAPGALTAMVVADLSGDGRDDIVCASLTTGAVHAALASPSGGFEPFTTASTTVAPLPFELGDVDGDHVPDVLFGPTDTAPARYLPGDGLAGFGAAVDIPTLPANDAAAVRRLREIVDLDGDGLPDVVVQEYDLSMSGAVVGASLTILRGLGAGVFDTPEQLQLSGGFLELTTFPLAFGGTHNTPEFFDADGDGALELLILTDDAAGVSVHRGLTDGSIAGLEFVGDDPALPSLRENVVADIDLDGDPDLVRRHDEGVLTTLENLGDGSFGAPTEYATGFSGSTQSYFVEHVDDDGRLDVLIAEVASNSTTVRVLFGQPGGTFSAPAPAQLFDNFNLLRVGDFDGDGRLDVVTRPKGGAPFFAKSFSVWLGQGDGSFVLSDTQPQPFEVLAFVAGDLDGDGDDDLLLRLPAEERVWTSLGDGTLVDSGVSIGGPLAATQLVDLDDDGALDRFFEISSRVYVQPGNGDGTFGSLAEVVDFSPWVGFGGLGELLAADLTGDGDLDIVGDSGRLIAPGDGAFGFAAPIVQTSYVPSGPYGEALFGARAADLDGDGFLDLVLRDFSGPSHSLIARNLLGNPWVGRGHALPGGFGTPRLRGLGTLAGGSTVTLALSDARPGAVSFLVVGLAEIALPFKGGTFVPAPTKILPAQLTSALGTAQRVLPVPPGFSGLQLWWQTWIADPAGPSGFAASNGLMSTLP